MNFCCYNVAQVSNPDSYAIQTDNQILQQNQKRGQDRQDPVNLLVEPDK